MLDNEHLFGLISTLVCWNWCLLYPLDPCLFYCSSSFWENLYFYTKPKFTQNFGQPMKVIFSFNQLLKPFKPTLIESWMVFQHDEKLFQRQRQSCEQAACLPAPFWKIPLLFHFSTFQSQAWSHISYQPDLNCQCHLFNKPVRESLLTLNTKIIESSNQPFKTDFQLVPPELCVSRERCLTMCLYFISASLATRDGLQSTNSE